MSNISFCLNIVTTYLQSTFYSKLPYENSSIGVYYNNFLYDILTIVPYELKDELKNISVFSDYIAVLSESTEKIDHSETEIGIIYVDTKNYKTNESIVITRLPLLRQISDAERVKFLSAYLKDFYFPFWMNYFHKKPDEEQSAFQDPKKGKEQVESAIQNYCNNNSIQRELISSYEQFIDLIAPDVFKIKISVAEEMQMRSEADKLDAKIEFYPTVLLKALVKLGLIN